MEEIKKIHIKGVTGIRYLSFLDRLDGRKDSRNNQLCEVEGGITTPRVIQKCRNCDQFTNEVYLIAANELQSIYTEVALTVEELKYPERDLEREKPHQGSCSEEELRQVAIWEEKRDQEITKHKNLLLRLAELRQICRNVDEALQHSLAQVQAVLKSHLESYWSGVLQSAAGDHLPISPAILSENLSGKTVYLEHKAIIEKMFTDIFGGE